MRKVKVEGSILSTYFKESLHSYLSDFNAMVSFKLVYTGPKARPNSLDRQGMRAADPVKIGNFSPILIPYLYGEMNSLSS